MPDLDCKPIGHDHNDNHYGKLINMQHKNNDDTPPVFSYIPIGSAVAVQREDSGPWTHGTIVGSGNYNHHGRSYVIQLTTNGRHITQNRWHIKPTTVTADAYIKHHSHKQCQLTTDPLAEILNNITKNPGSYNTKQTTNNNNKSDSKQKEEEKGQWTYGMEASNTTKQPVIRATKDNRTVTEYGDNIRTRSGHISKKPDRLEYR